MTDISTTEETYFVDLQEIFINFMTNGNQATVILA